MIEHLVLKWIYADSKKPAELIAGRWWLAYGWRMYTPCFIGVAIVLPMTVFVLPGVAAKDFWPVIGIIALFTSLGLPVYIEARYRKVAYDQDCIQSYSPWGASRTVYWRDVVSLKFSPVMQWWVLTTDRQEKIRIGMFMRGIRDLVTECAKRRITVDLNGWTPEW